MRSHIRAGERKSVARFSQHFSSPRLLTAIGFRFFAMIAPVLVVCMLGFVGYEAIASGHHGVLAAVALPAVPAFTKEEGQAALTKHLTELNTAIIDAMKKYDEEIATQGKASAETKTALEKLGTDWKEASERLMAVEQKLTSRFGKDGAPGSDSKTIGEMLTDSEQFKSMVKQGQRGTGQVQVGSFHKTNVVNATGQNQPLVQSVRVPGIIIPGGLQRLTVRDLLSVVPTQGNLIEFVKETSFTNNAGSQANEGDAKPESALAFSLTSVAVKTLAHFIPASKQILSDAPALQAYINSRLMFGLKYYEEQELLNGTGSGAHISGLIANATAFDTTRTTIATDNYADVISHALQQVRDGSFTEPTGIIMNARDWELIRLMKSTTGEYLGGGPFLENANTLWGKPVVATPAIAQSQFLVGDFVTAAAIWDRDDATVEVSREHSDFFVRNLVAILAEERLALTVYRPLAFVYGGFPYGS